MSSIPGRPVPRIRPVSAPDEHRDPIDAPPAHDFTKPTTLGLSPPGTPSQRRSRSEPTVQLNVRVAEDIEQLLDHAGGQLGWTKRQLVEQAIRAAYGTA